MKKTLLFLVGLAFVSCYERERNCADFKTGTFEFEQEINGEKQKSTFIRTEDTEIETYKEKTDTAVIRWINDCEYVLQKINPKNRAEQKGVHIKILSTSRNEYQFEYGLVGANEKQKGTIRKISGN